MSTREIIPLLAMLCEYLRKLTLEACGHRLRIKDFSPRNVAFFETGWAPPGGGLSQGPGGGLSPQGGIPPHHGWACCDFGNWEVLAASSGREVWHHQNDILKRLESCDSWARRSNAFECMRSWLVSRQGEHLAIQAADYLQRAMNLR